MFASIHHSIHDVVVVGAGSAGCVLAARLSENPHRKVLLLEAGPDYRRPELPVDLADGHCLPSGRLGRTQRPLHDWHLESVAGVAGTPSVPLPRGRVVGGSSAVNGTFAMRGYPQDYDDWAAAGNPGWSYPEVEKTFRQLETDLDFGDRPWHGSSGPLPVRRPQAAELSALAATFLGAATTVGHPLIEDHNEPGAVGIGPLPSNTVDRLRHSAALTHLEPARDRPNLTVRGHAPVTCVELAEGRAVGVRLTDGTLVEAGTVILAAGTYLSPVILHRSGIGPAALLATAGIPPRHVLEGVGRNLVDHVLVSVDVLIRPEPALRPHYQALASVRADEGSGPPDLHLFAAGPYPVKSEDAELASLVVGLLDPDSRGEVRAVSPDPDVTPEIDLAYLSDDAGRDLATLVAGVGEARRILAAEPFGSLTVGEERSPGTATASRSEVEAAVTKLARTYHHPVGSCAMGPDPDAGAVVDARGHVHGIPGLMVADASIMPRIPRANTNLPTMMLAERIAEWIT